MSNLYWLTDAQMAQFKPFFPKRLRVPRVDEVLAVLAPTVGPIVGGWITETYSWHWLFLINVVPGVLAVAVAAVVLPRLPTCVALIRAEIGCPWACWPLRWRPSRLPSRRDRSGVGPRVW